MWIAGFALLAYRVQGMARLGLIVAALVSCATVWGSGSRTAMLLACCSVVGAAWAFWKLSRSARVRLIGAVGIATIVAAGALAVLSGAIAQGPLKRIETAIQRSRGRQGLVRYLWERDGYGTAAVQMIKESPLVGVGPGAFYALVMDYSRLKDPSSGINTDNAQNWFRHELAELGVLGSLGWICLVTMLAVNIGRSRVGSNAEQATLIAAALVGLGLASMLGMPTQHIVALILFWTFVFWHHQLAASRDEYAWLMPSRAKWVVVAIVLAAFAVGTTYIARTSFRVPHRALRFGWPFTYGFERVNLPSAQPFRRTARKAVTVFPTQDRYVKMTFWVEHPDIGSNPVTIRIWRDSRLIAGPTLSSHAPVTWYVRTRPDHPWMMIETEVDRTWKEVVQRGSPRREFGVTIEDWQFVAQPPIYAVLVE
jgi:hypothetical protein